MRKLLLISALCFILGIPQLAMAQPPFRIAYFSKDPTHIDPLGTAFDPDSYSVITQIFDSLIHLDLDGNLVPGLALSWKKLSNVKWALSLRQGVKFHNGEDFNAQAVKFTFDYVLNPQNKTGNIRIYGGIIKEVKVLSPFEITIETNAPDGMFLKRLVYFGPICPPRYIQEKGIENFHSHPVGTGPFEFESWEKGRSINLKANQNYWQKGHPYLDKVKFLVLEEQQGAKSIASNKVDFVPNLSGIHTRALMANKQAHVQIIKRLTLLSYLVLLKNEGPLADVNVRRALNYALNKEDMVRFADSGNAKIQASLGREGEFGAAKDLTPYPYDPEKAKKLLIQAGYKEGFTLKIAASDSAESITKIMKANFEAIGIKLKVDIMSRNELMNRAASYKIVHGKPMDYDLAIILVDDPINHFGFLAGIFFDSQKPSSLCNFTEFDKRITEAMSETDPKKHEQLLQELDRYFHEQALSLFTTQRIITAAVRKEFIVDKVGMNGHLDYQILSDVRYKAPNIK